MSYTSVMPSTSAHITHDASARAGRACVHVRTANPLERAPEQHERDNMHTLTQSHIERPALTPSQIADRTPPSHCTHDFERSAWLRACEQIDAERRAQRAAAHAAFVAAYAGAPLAPISQGGTA
tara:strand:+ start:25 stop:396 length:372 start_codon:yes stop_codon:yes gene_type:complete